MNTGFKLLVVESLKPISYRVIESLEGIWFAFISKFDPPPTSKLDVAINFESFETMLAQVQEMLYIEKGGDEQLEDELKAYNPLVPNGKELTTTLMFEIDNPVSRSAFLGKVGGIEEKVFMRINNEVIKGMPEKDVDRTSTEGKASSVQFVHFKFNDEQIINFKSEDANIELGIEHQEYSHITKLTKANIESLSKDFI